MEPTLGRALDLCLLTAAEVFDPAGAGEAEMKVVLEMFGLDVSQARRQEHIEVLVCRGWLTPGERDTYHLNTDLKTLIPLHYPHFALFQLLSSLTQGIVSRFEKMPGSWRYSTLVLLRPEQHQKMYDLFQEQVDGFLASVHVPPAQVGRGEADQYTLVTLSTLVAPLLGREFLRAPLAEKGKELVLTTTAAECMRRLGPWTVAEGISQRRFVERVSESTGLKREALYRHLREEYGLSSPNTIRRWLAGDALYPQDPSESYFRGVVLESCVAIRRILTRAWPEPVDEVKLRHQVARDRDVREIDNTTWRNALRFLKDEDILLAISARDGISYTLRHGPSKVTAEEVAKMEEQLRDFFPRVLEAICAAGAQQTFSRCETRVWCVHRSKLLILDELAREVWKGASNLLNATWKRLPPETLPGYGCVPGLFLAQARIFPFS